MVTMLEKSPFPKETGDETKVQWKSLGREFREDCKDTQGISWQNATH